ncbi:MAG: hypothetical protein GEU88_20760 [Solirubrobacterales bacterium]|nr:hypothetical protein [Solirubrobacterales bacterium]
MNLCVGAVDRRDDDIVVRFGSNELVLPPASLSAYPKVTEYVGRKVAVGMRSESFFRPEATVSERYRFRAEVNLIEVLGAEALIHLTTDASPVITDEVADAFEDADAFEEYREHHRGGFTMVARADPRNLPERHQMIDVPRRLRR